MSISYPYQKKLIDEGEIVDPRIIINVKTIKGFLAIKFLVDSGADVTTLPLNPYAELFKFRIKPKEKVTIGGIEGQGVAAYPFTIQVLLNSQLFPLRCYFIRSKIDPLLGRLDFWNRYSINFNNKASKTILTSIIKVQ